MYAINYAQFNIKIACMQDEIKKYTKPLGERIRKLRNDKNLTLQNVCYKNFLEPSTLSRIEKGKVEPKYVTLIRIAKAFDMKVSELLDF